MSSSIAPTPSRFRRSGQHVVVAAGRRHELEAALPQAAHARDDVLDRDGQVLDAVAPVLLDEDVDLRVLEERPPGLVVRELHARAPGPT